MLVTYLHAAGIPGVTKGAIRKAVAAGKLTATKDEQGRWLVHAGDVQRVWPRAPECGDQRVPVPDRDQAPVIAELRARLEAETRARETAEAHVRDLLRRLDQATKSAGR